MTPDQLPLLEVDPRPRLTDRQQRVLDALRAAGADGLEASECGAIAHEIKQTRWRHSADERCQFCGSDGLQILQRLRDLGLARYRSKLKRWQAVGEPQPEDERSGRPLTEEEALEEFGF